MAKMKLNNSSDVAAKDASTLASLAKKKKETSIDNPSNAFTSYLEVLVSTYPRLCYVEGSPQVMVVLDDDAAAAGANYNRVAVISGSGSGNELAHASYVGDGVLTAAIHGDIFASAPVDLILAGIRAVTVDKGCLIIMPIASDGSVTGMMELGVGIHGEHGAVLVDLEPVEDVVSRVLAKIPPTKTGYLPIEEVIEWSSW